jgi:CBS domain containing-hemolysin-like protein
LICSRGTSMELFKFVFDILIILFFVLLNGFFVAAEFAIVKVRITQIEPLILKGNFRAKIARGMITNLNAYLSATQLGITMTSLALGWIGEPLVAERLMPIFTGMGIGSANLIHGVSFGIAFFIITFLHIVLGELAPKSMAIIEAKKTALTVAYPLNIFYVIFKPAILALNWVAGIILKSVGFRTADDSELAHSEEELRLILSKNIRASGITRKIALSALDFHLKQARHAMVPRREISALSILAPVEENIRLMNDNKYSRYPVFKETIDNVIGIVHIKDVFKNDRHLQKDFTLYSVLRDASFLPETASLEKTLATILQKKSHMLILADEYGGTAGLITLENVLEELVGNIQDEYDRETPDIVKVRENEFIVAGGVTTNDVERLLTVELSPMDIRSIGGFIIEQLEHIPKVGEQLILNGVKFTAEKITGNVIETVRIEKIPVTTDNPDQ